MRLHAHPKHSSCMASRNSVDQSNKYVEKLGHCIEKLQHIFLCIFCGNFWIFEFPLYFPCAHNTVQSWMSTGVSKWCYYTLSCANNGQM